MLVYKLIIIKSAFLCYKTTDQISEELRYCFQINVHHVLSLNLRHADAPLFIETATTKQIGQLQLWTLYFQIWWLENN